MSDTDPTLIADYRNAIGCFAGLKVYWSKKRALGFATPVPSQSELDAFYATEFRRVLNKGTGLAFYRSSPNYLARARRQVQSVIPHVARGTGRWLDVGAGYGLLLDEARKALPSWELIASESDDDARRVLADVASSVVDNFWTTKQDREYDVVSLSHVLEHLADPAGALIRVRDSLRPGGVAMIEVPNDDWPRLSDPSRKSDLPHLWFFSLSGLCRLISEAGLDIISAHECGILLRPGLADRTIWWLKRKVGGSFTVVNDSRWNANGPGRADIRVVARRPEKPSY